jgi:uncharacterized membrane protein
MTEPAPVPHHDDHFYRFHRPHLHLTSTFGDDWFAQLSERFAQWFISPGFALWRTVFIVVWITANVVGWLTVDEYPFRFLNLLLSMLTMYAAPLILLAQTRQAERDKAYALADAQHREEIGRAAEARQAQLAEQTKLLVDLVKANTAMTETLSILTEQVARLTTDVHTRVVTGDAR